MRINNIEVVDRHARPSVLSKVALRTFFINDGSFTDPYAISSVSIYDALDNMTPSGILETSSNQIASGSMETALMVFAPSGGTNPSGSETNDNAARQAEVVVAVDGVITEQFRPGNYTGQLGTASLDYDEGNDPAGICSGVSGVYRLGTGEYAVVLDGGIDLSGVRHGEHGPTPNKASAAGDYIDVWTVKMTQNSEWTTVINQFKLFTDTFYNITEPLLLRTSHRLLNKHVSLGSRVDLKISTEMTVENRNIDQNIKNLMKDIGIKNTGIKIEKVNESPHLPSFVTVSGFADTSGLLDVTADNTIVHNWGTYDLSSIGDNHKLGSHAGTYYITAEYEILNQKIVTKPMPIIVT